MTGVTSGVGARLEQWRGRLSGDGLKARCVRGSMVLGIGAFGAKALGFASKKTTACTAVAHAGDTVDRLRVLWRVFCWRFGN